MFVTLLSSQFLILCDILKAKLCEEPLLRPDFPQPFILTTDSSGFCNRRYLSTYEKEALAIIFCVTHFRPYLYRRKLTLVTDHKPLVWFQNSKDSCSRVSRWRLKLTEYDFDVVYKFPFLTKTPKRVQSHRLKSS